MLSSLAFINTGFLKRTERWHCDLIANQTYRPNVHPSRHSDHTSGIQGANCCTEGGADYRKLRWSPGTEGILHNTYPQYLEIAEYLCQSV